MWPWSKNNVDKPIEKKAPAIGIDLGTTRSCVSFWCPDRKRAKVASTRGPPPQRLKMRTVPSIVAFCTDVGKGTHAIVGEAARLQAIRNPSNTVSNAKRLIGRKFDDASVQDDLKYFPFTVVSSGEMNEPFIQIMGGKRGTKQVFYSPEDISSMILLEMKNIAERYLKQEVTDAVITVPAYFNRNQRRATRTAGEVVGLKVLQILSEPTAAAMAYGLHIVGSKLVIVFDFGGGTLDVSLLRITDGKFDVIGLGGDSHLGGEDIDNNILEHFVKQIKQQSDGLIDVFASPELLTDMKARCEELKIMLSDQETAELIFKAPLPNKEGSKKETFTFRGSLSRRELVDMNEEIFKRCMIAVEAVLHETQTDCTAVDEVVLVGGSTRVPEVRRLLSDYFGGKELCTGVNPDEAVAQGAAIQAAVLSGVDQVELRDILMLDRIPLPIGLKDGNGDFAVLIPKNTPIPTIVKKQFRTCEDNQPAITVKIFEGENPVAEDNVFLGYFDFPIRQYKGAKAGERLMEVSFELTPEGLLKVSADTLNVPPAPLLGPWAWALISLYLVVIVACVVAYFLQGTGEGDPSLLDATSSDPSTKMWCTSSVFSYLPQCQDTLPQYPK